MANCAWCGDAGDEHGSHSICPEHATTLVLNYHAARELGQAPEHMEILSTDANTQQAIAGTFTYGGYTAAIVR